MKILKRICAISLVCSLFIVNLRADTLSDLMEKYGKVTKIEEGNAVEDTINDNVSDSEIKPQNDTINEAPQGLDEPPTEVDKENNEAFDEDSYKEIYSDKDRESVQFTCNNESRYPSYIDTGIKENHIDQDNIKSIITQIVNSNSDNQIIKSDGSNLILVDGRLVEVKANKEYTVDEMNTLFSQTNIKFEFMQSKQNNQFVLSDYLEKNQDFKFIIKGKEIILDKKPFIENNRVLFPLREVAEGLEIKVNWNHKTGIISMMKDGKKFILKENSRILTIQENGQERTINVQAIPRILDIDGEARIYGYIDVIVKELGYEIYWDANMLAVVIEDEKAN